MDLRPKLHFTPRNNWMNDPNGFCHFKGKYHLYFQHNPYARVWGTMHWGHATSDDLIHWEEQAVVMAPEFDFDAQGVFSGSVLLEGDKQHFYYTGVRYLDGSRDISKTYQTVGYAWSEDGQVLHRESQPMMVPDPDLVTVTEFRDPKLWQHEDHTYMIIGGSYKEEGQAYIYRSTEGEAWELFTVIHKKNSGRVWECPDIIDLDGRLFLTASIMDVYYGGQQNIAVIAPMTLDYVSGEWSLGEFDPMDYGLDFYAAQSMAQTVEGMPPVVIGWLRMSDVLNDSCSWSGMQSLPRELVLRDRQVGYRLPDTVDDEPWVDVKTGRLDIVEPLTQTYLLKGTLKLTDSFRFELFSNGDTGLTIGFDPDEEKLYADRRGLMAGAPGLKGMPGRLWFPDIGKEAMDITILADKSVVEIFIDEGTRAMTLTLNPKKTNTAVDLRQADEHITITAFKCL